MAKREDRQTLGHYIRTARVERGLGLRQLARDLEVTPSYLSDIENERRVPSQEVLQAIAQRLSLDFDELLALAGRVGSEAEDYLRGLRSPAAVRLFRRIAEHRLDERDLVELLKRAEELGRRKR